jgi:hypothetical protein
MDIATVTYFLFGLAGLLSGNMIWTAICSAA